MGYLYSNLLPSAPCSYPYLPEYCKTSTLTIGSGSFSPRILSLFGLVTYHGTSPLENIGLGHYYSFPLFCVTLLTFLTVPTSISYRQYYSSSPFKYTKRKIFWSCLELLISLSVLSRARSHNNAFIAISLCKSRSFFLHIHKLYAKPTKVEKRFESLWIFHSSPSLDFPFSL